MDLSLPDVEINAVDRLRTAIDLGALYDAQHSLFTLLHDHCV